MCIGQEAKLHSQGDMKRYRQQFKPFTATDAILILKFMSPVCLWVMGGKVEGVVHVKPVKRSSVTK